MTEKGKFVKSIFKNNGSLGRISRMQNAEYRIQNTECRMQNAEYRIQNAECRIQNAEYEAEYRIREDRKQKIEFESLK